MLRLMKANCFSYHYIYPNIDHLFINLFSHISKMMQEAIDKSGKSHQIVLCT
jgi:hypothetical protein